MPDVTRSDSQRSDASHKPRVSFNRDVHVKRIGREGVVSALAGDGEGHLVPLAVRRERPGRLSRRELEQEAEAILRQAERVRCTPATTPLGPDKFSTLPSRPRAKHSAHSPASSIFNSLDRKGKRKDPGSDRMARRYSNPDNTTLGKSYNSSPERTSQEVPQRRKLNRSVSDAGHREVKKDKERTSIFGTLDRIRKKKKKPPSFSENTKREEVVAPVRKKKQLSPIIEMSPKVEGGPFRFTPTGSPSAVVYAEVVARPYGKTTVHTAVPASPSPRQDLRPESEDEGVDMGHRGTQSRTYSYENDITRSISPKEYTVDIKREMDLTPKRKDDEIRGDQIINMLRSRSNPLLDEEVVGGYRREVRTERVIRVHEADEPNEPDGRGRADGMDYGTKRRVSKDFVDEELPLKSNYYVEVNKTSQSYDDLDRIKYQEPIRAWTPPLETSLIDSNNLSYRRDRLESRLTNHKRRFLSSAHENKSYRDNIKGEDLRKDFLKSQIDDKERGYFEKKIATEIDTHHRQQLLKNKDVLADSGIEMSDYRKDTSKDVATMNRRNAETTTRITRTETSRTRSSPSLNKTEYNSDGEKRYKTDASTRLIEEERRKKDVVPASSTLVKSYSKPIREEHKSVTRKEEKVTKEKKKDKLTRMDRVKQLMFGSKDSKKNKKKNKKAGEDEVDLLRSRYTEYKGSDVSVNSSPVIHRRRHTSSSEVDDRTDQELEFYGSRQRLATPSPSEHKADDTWLKSLTRRNKHGKVDKKHKIVNGHGEDSLRSHTSNNKHLRFFGDSDRESVRSGNHRHRDSSPNPNLLQVPHSRRVLAPDSSAESTTEGDSSQHSQKSVVYLHAATVGDIPGSRKLHRSVISGGRRSMSREELSSNSEVITPQSRTLSRSISVLAPWRPKHNRQEINYDGGGKPPKAPKLKKPEEVKKPAHKDKENHKKSSRELRKSKENLIDYQEDSRRGSSESIFGEKKRGRSNGNLVFVGKRGSYDTSDSNRNHHTIDRSHHKSSDRMSEKSRDLSRSISIPKDSRVSSGWFKGKSSTTK